MSTVFAHCRSSTRVRQAAWALGAPWRAADMAQHQAKTCDSEAAAAAGDDGRVGWYQTWNMGGW